MPRQENAQSHIHLMASQEKQKVQSLSSRVSMILASPKSANKKRENQNAINASENVRLCLGEFCGRKPKNAGSSNVMCGMLMQGVTGKAGTHLIKRLSCSAQCVVK
jgi:hypothetical protein